MRQILWVIGLFTLVTLIAIFAMLNHHAIVINLLVSQQNTTLITALAAAFGLGALIACLLLGYPLLRANMRCRTLTTKNRQFEKRLHHLQGVEKDSG